MSLDNRSRPLFHTNLTDIVIGVGAARSGTTWLWRCLNAHPDVHMSQIKETNYFSHDLIGVEGPRDQTTLPALGASTPELESNHVVARVCDTQRYLQLLCGQNCRHSGEISPSYLYYATTVAPRIHAFQQDVKIIILLREPAIRALSNHDQFSRSGRESLPFRAALAAEPARMASGWEHGWAYTGLGLYHDAVVAYLDVFAREQLWIGLYEDLARSPLDTFHAICDFLGIRRMAPATTDNINRGKNVIGPITRLSRTKWGLRARAVVSPALRQTIRTSDLRSASNRRLQNPALKNELARLRRQVFAPDVRKLDRLLPQLSIIDRWGY